jgi:signal transduction histidine kinase
MPKVACLFFSLFVFTILDAQQLPLETYTPANGLVDARVSKMFQDSKGLLYFLTPGGFSIFDGQHFDNYGTESNYGTGIISDITEYKNAVVKLFSYDGDVYSIKNNHFVSDTSKRSLLREVSKIFTINNDDKIFLTNYRFLKEKDNKFQVLNIGSIKPGFIEHSLLYGQYLLLVQSGEDKKQKIFLYHYGSEKIVDSLPVKSSVSFISNFHNKVVMSTLSNSWFSFDSLLLQNGKLKLLPFNSAKILPANFTTFKIQHYSADNNIWFIDPEKGYCRVNLSNNAKEYFSVSDGVLNTANWVFEDAEKNYWFGSTARGVQKLQWSSLVIQSKISNIELGTVTAINKTATGESFISATGGVFINEKKAATSFKDNSDFIFWQNEFWHFTDYKTLCGSKGTVFHLDKLIPGYTADNFLFSHSNINKQGGLMIAGRVFIFIDTHHHFHFFKPNYFCDNIVETANNEYWCFLRNNEVIQLRWNHDSIKKSYEQVIPNLEPRFALQWDSNTFFVATRLGGIRILRWLNGQLKETGVINKLNGLSNNFVNVLLRRDKVHLLAGTAAGLDQITLLPNDTSIENIAQRNNIFTPFTHLVQLQDSVVLCKAIDGQVFKLMNSSRPPSDYSPVAFFKTISINNQDVDFIQQHRFEFNSNNFLFKASAPSFFDNKKTVFSFLLKGGGQVWQQNSNSPDFEIKNLLPSTYSLILNIQYPGKIYPDCQLLYNFTIEPPFWKRWWFIMAVIILSIAVVIYAVKWFYKRRLQRQIIELEKQQAIEKERTRIATDMHDDFGANLSRIKFISEKIQVINKTDDNLKSDLVKISLYSDEMAEKMNEIVWALNQRYDSLDDLVSFSRAYAADYLQDKNIQLIFSADTIINKKIHGEVRRNIFMVVKEALHNVVKHAGASIVTIAFREQDKLIVTIGDNGKGIDLQHIRPFANGIDNMKKRMESIGGQIQLLRDNGTLIIMQVPV